MTLLEEAQVQPPQFRNDDSLVIESLERASKMLHNVGWIQGAGVKWDNVTGQAVGYCLIGSVSSAVLQVSYENNLPPVNTLWGDAISALHEIVPGRDIATYNDNPDRTFEEVADVMQRALDYARGLI